MRTFKNIEKLGLKFHSITGIHVVSANSLEDLLQSAQVVYGHGNDRKPLWDHEQTSSDTHSALLLCVEPLKKKTKAEATLELLERLAKDPAYYSGLGTSAARAILEMKDEA